MRKKIIFIALLALSASMNACSSDKEDEPNGLHDWEITKSIYNQQTKPVECDSRWNEYLYDKTYEYVQRDKALFESQSTKFYKYKYAYKKIR